MLAHEAAVRLGAFITVQLDELRFRTDAHRPPRLCPRLLRVYGAGALAYTYLGYAGREAVARQAGAIRKAVLALASSCAAHERQGTCPMHQRHQHPRGSHECCQTAACSDSSEIRSDTDSPATTN
jgi:hypothetical protein